MPAKKTERTKRRVFVNAGCGSKTSNGLPQVFRNWEQIRVDINPMWEPDVVASIDDLSAIPDGVVDAVWCSHSMEHLFAHQVPAALAEFRRILKKTGFACIIVPDIQQIAHWISDDKMQETIYQSAAGPVTAQDMIWGFRPAIEQGLDGMAHRCGFTPTVFLDYLKAAGFSEIVLRRRTDNLELAGVAMRTPCKSAEERGKRMEELGL
jgi:hypothetical protein